MTHLAPLSRRFFITAGLSAAGGLAIGVALPESVAAFGIDAAPFKPAGDGKAAEVNAWILIEPDDSVIIRVAKSEMGEGILTALPMIVAEELECDWTKVRAEYADAHRNFVESKPYGPMSTGGSGAVRRSREYLQQAGASARARLIAAAAKQWGVAEAECTARDGKVSHAATKRSLGYGVLASAAAKVALAQEPAIKTPDQYRLIGTPQARFDTPHKINGAAKFGIDTRLDGMLYAAVATCPVFGGTVKAVDDSKVKGRRGIKQIVPIPGGVAVVADSFWRAKEAVGDLVITWDEGAGAGTSSDQFRKDYRAALDGPAANAKHLGDPAGVLAKAAKKIDALYEAPHVAHAAMEPLNATVHVQADRLDAWIGTQDPDGALQRAATAAGMKPEQVFIHNCFLGGGFGRRAINDELTQAVIVAKAVGQPVKLVWTREEDMQHDRYRPQAAIRFKAGFGGDGMPVAWDMRTAVGSISRSLGRDPVTSGVEPSAVEGLANVPYAVANLNVDCILKNTHVPVMFWRSVGSSQNAFALESFVDEMAVAAGKDPYEFRRALLAGQPDFLKVLDTLAEKGDWSKKLPAGQGRGIAIHESFGTIVGEIVEVAVSPKGEIKVPRVVAVVDCGHVVNPRTVEMQIESAVIYGLTAALYDEITIKDGRVEQANFDEYQMVRFADAPAIETYLALSGGGKWGGIGEPGTPPIAPALCNAIFAATGKRIRSLPIKNTDLSGRA
ncbi:xanthine dehydrogenase family protein molybdopterin-binding subunit [Aliidongia dinghuensis]|nr:xanthine dehydrogenase family protein molybdopterin-binding subunit [Aliidongia dinghuensis]